MSILLTLSLPLLAAPDRVAHVLPASSSGGLSSSQDLVLAPDGTTVLLADPVQGQLAALDTRTWELDRLALCDGARGAAPYHDGAAQRVFVGCGDGRLRLATLEEGWLSDAGESVEVAEGAVLAVQVVDGQVFALAEDGSGGLDVHRYDPESGALDSLSGFPSALSQSGAVDMESNGTWLFVLHGSDNLSKLDVSTGAVVIAQNGLSSLNGEDLVAVQDGGPVFAAGGAAVAWFDLSGNDWSLYLSGEDGLEGVEALCLLPGDGRLLLADGLREELLLYEYDTSSHTFGDELLEAIPYGSSGASVSEAVLLDPQLILGTDAGELWIATRGPWVDLVSLSPEAAADGDEVELRFQSDRDGSYELRLGGSGASDGVLLQSGEVQAGSETALWVPVDESFAEGANLLRVRVKDSAGQVGHDGAWLTVDNPPPAIQLAEDAVGVGNGYLSLRLTTPSDEDLASIRVYLSVEPFEPEDWAGGGGPAFDGEDPIDEGDLLFAVEPDALTELVISPLTNDQTYHLAVRAIDAGGLEGPMSNVRTGTPRLTQGIADLAGERGGFCGLPLSSSAGLAILALSLAGARRRRLGGALGLGLLALAGPAQAAGKKEVEPEDKVMGATALRIGPMTWAEDNEIVEVLGENGHTVFWLESGPSWRGYAQLGFGLGFYRKKGTLLTTTGESSAQDDVFFALPVTMNLTLRLDVIDEQVLVPYVTAGGDAWFWREQWTVDAEGTKEGIGGGKWGYHYGLGGQLLLDVFDRGRAGLAFSRAGIRDSYVTAEWRRQEVGVFQEGIDLSSSQFTIGLGIHY